MDEETRPETATNEGMAEKLAAALRDLSDASESWAGEDIRVYRSIENARAVLAEFREGAV